MQDGRLLDARESGSRTGGASFSLGVRLRRILFSVCWLAFARWTPPQARGWRRILLNLFGANVARTANVYSSAKIWYPPNLSMSEFSTLGPRVRCYNQAAIHIGPYAIVSQDASLCAGTHDYEDEHFQLIVRPITIGKGAWIAAEAFVGPGVTVGDHAVLGARAVAMKNLEEAVVYSGNPARMIKMRETIFNAAR
ncbi:LbetaH domain-containing protein [Stakelama tenebrarum]|uniref:Putative colanic acid biosynthesis acetyltransferase n=1 Tax=Stakelama tenebrarum TaxID=2711215 RepID=A0A6G6Y4L9_9SPHN|nr:putative colanic acid biosynthesis acetyltransferase [Sphingosinithalassobacter tenebrarum]QIG79516.1 putative colanic acid biosynthesis acetyltransferase [Sphingosinithalassobacter tenebrarum]